MMSLLLWLYQAHVPSEVELVVVGARSQTMVNLLQTERGAEVQGGDVSRRLVCRCRKPDDGKSPTDGKGHRGVGAKGQGLGLVWG